MTYCVRCNKPLKSDDAKAINMPAATGAGTTISVCLDYSECKPVPIQTSPYSIRH